MKKFLILLSVMLSACSTASTSEVICPNSNTEYVINCPSTVDWQHCYDNATKKCPSGYTTLYENSGLEWKELRVYCPR